MPTQNMNQFSPSLFPGMLDLQVGGLGPAFTFRIDPDSAVLVADGIQGGEGLKIVDGGANDPNGVPLCDVLAADTDIPFGARIYDLKNGIVQAGDIVQCSYNGNIQWMAASGALNRWAEVQLNVLVPGQVVAKAAGALFGRLLDKSFAAGDIVRVLVGTGPV